MQTSQHPRSLLSTFDVTKEMHLFLADISGKIRNFIQTATLFQSWQEMRSLHSAWSKTKVSVIWAPKHCCAALAFALVVASLTEQACTWAVIYTEEKEWCKETSLPSSSLVLNGQKHTGKVTYIQISEVFIVI